MLDIEFRQSRNEIILRPAADRRRGRQEKQAAPRSSGPPGNTENRSKAGPREGKRTRRSRP
jgi:hypothetical protein